MNKRLKELQLKANAYANDLKPVGMYAWHQAYDKKFAEMIVQECVVVLRDYNVDYVEDVLQEHFGDAE